MARAIILKYVSVDDVVVNAATLGFDLSHLYDEMECNDEYQMGTILICDGDVWNNNITFTCKNTDDFASAYAFIDYDDKDEWGFSPIRRL